MVNNETKPSGHNATAWTSRFAGIGSVEALAAAPVVAGLGDHVLERAFEHAPNGIALVDLEGRFVSVNAAFCEVLGYARAELVGTFAQDMTHPPDLDVGTDLALQVLRGEATSARISRRYVRKDGSVAHLVKHLTLHRDDAGNPRTFIVHYEDVTKQEQAMAALEMSERRFRAFAMQAPVGIFETNAAGRCTFINPNWLTLTGLTCEEALGDGWKAALHPDDAERVLAGWSHAVDAGVEVSGGFRVVSKDGSVSWVQVTAVPVRPESGSSVGHIGTITDITDGHHAEAALRHSLDEKRALLQEIHHRVKNNLQVISSLLRMQSRVAPQPEARAALDDSEARVRSIALLHESLYRSADLARVDFDSYMRDLVSNLLRTHPAEGRPAVEVSCEDLYLDMAVAMPCGLVVNELVTNALKHAFVGRTTGHIAIRASFADGKMELVVEDDGVGTPPAAELDAKKRPTLGLSLVRSLAKQLDADLEVDSARGTRHRLRFAMSRDQGGLR
jgi:PAS domain S-box-containing protein